MNALQPHFSLVEREHLETVLSQAGRSRDEIARLMEGVHLVENGNGAVRPERQLWYQLLYGMQGAGKPDVMEAAAKMIPDFEAKMAQLPAQEGTIHFALIPYANGSVFPQINFTLATEMTLKELKMKARSSGCILTEENNPVTREEETVPVGTKIILNTGKSFAVPLKMVWPDQEQETGDQLENYLARLRGQSTAVRL